MKIALYYPWIYLKSGVERTILETVRRSNHDITVFTNYYNPKDTYKEFKKINVIQLNRIPIKSGFFSWIKCAIMIAKQKIDLNKFDLFFVNTEGLADLIMIKNKQKKNVLLCFTPLRLIYDRYHRSNFLSDKNIFQKILFTAISNIFQLLDKKIWQHFDLVIFDSKESLRRARSGKLLGSLQKNSVIYPGSDWEDIMPSWKYNKYFFVPGRITHSKNIELAINAFRLFQNKYDGTEKFDLIIAGQVDSKSKDYFSYLQEISKDIVNIKYFLNPTERQMKNLYSNCYSVLATAINEDWGLTPVEANSYGKPVLAVNSGGFKESQINGKTGYLIKNDPNSFSIKMIELAKNAKLTLKMGRLARLHSRKFSWNKYIKPIDTELNNFLGSQLKN